ncbi:nuclear transport factor 2 family protein [Paracidovorax citrulli]|uniref:Nuclear transport factor 2 family protein n=2 Tax=Paracidovorax citrulli TaxID=80869 RepID=A1TQB0_PARC0|nr:nuclear transport factor 2 family protein [Paracidovorax citrulli]ABM33148.1 conserved hypothetical protein [Paracidovorax citrulli AAC00-1]ATG92908.1 nuclear transport factor 2 family protein [Paracidovorax citrulli]MVT28986.1 nuclear transport factor 2 family protein [Paracidovorax citrulli]MVT36676.1 nuclear transport factor 2 family protein [Paracidovorax citrulli]PVY67379.1 putative lumazine-binding protein [Paracidovorax citrulli]
MTTPFDDITALLQAYFDGLYHSDAEKLRTVFHPDALYACATGGNLVCMRMDEYLPIVARRPSPASRGDPREDRIVAIEFAGPVTAMARVQCAILPRHFTDLLTLVLLDGRWQVMAKVFHYELDDTLSS